MVIGDRVRYKYMYKLSSISSDRELIGTIKKIHSFGNRAVISWDHTFKEDTSKHISDIEILNEYINILTALNNLEKKLCSVEEI